MGMTSYVIGIKPADEKFQKMIAVRDACHAAGLTPPDEVYDYFAGHPEEADPAGVTVHMRPEGVPPCGVTRWRDDSRGGFEVDIRKIDPDIKILRFVMSY